MGARSFAEAIEEPFRSVARWLHRWHELGVEGVQLVTAKGSNGKAWAIDPGLPRRYELGELPDPRRRRRSATTIDGASNDSDS